MKKVRITSYYDEYINKIGEVIGTFGNVYNVRMPNGAILHPYMENLSFAQCEIVSHQPEQLPIFN